MKIRLGYACISNTINVTSSSTVTYSYYKKVGINMGNKKIDTTILSNFNN